MNLLNFNESIDFSPKARRRSRLTTKWSDSKSLYLEIDVSSGANSFETEKLRLSAFQNGVFCWILTSRQPLKVDFESIVQIRDFNAEGATTKSSDHDVFWIDSGF